MGEGNRKVWITSSDHVSSVCDNLPSNIGRQSLVSSLIKAYGFDVKCDGIIPIPHASKRELEGFHGKSFVEELLKDRDDDSFSQEGELANEDLDQLASFGLTDDCFVFEGLDEYVKLVAGSSIATARKLILDSKDLSSGGIYINWYGGRHHCHKNTASGFCYVNDIVLAINTLRSRFKNIFYLDLDLHHGDGVESAFKSTKTITTCSVHRYDVGFFPGTGLLESSKDSVINIPMKKGLNDEMLMNIVNEIVLPVIEKKSPDVLVIQCGCDGLATDRHKEWNLTINGFGTVLQKLLETVNIPVLLLGGGGYNNEEAAKCWTYLTKVALGVDFPQEDVVMIPEHPYLDSYADSGYAFWTPQNTTGSKMKDQNTIEYINEIKDFIINKCT